MRVKRPLWLASGALALVIGSLIAWTLYSRFSAPADFDWDAIEGYGHRGQLGTGTGVDAVSIKCPYWSKGNRLVLSGYSEFPGKKRGPAYLLLIRLATNQDSEYFGGTRSEGGAHIVDQSFTARDGKLFQIQYTLTKKHISEEFRVGGTVYPLESGRLFMLDLRTRPVQVTQIKDDLAGLLPTQDPEKADLQNSVDKAQERYEAIRSFWKSR